MDVSKFDVENHGPLIIIMDFCLFLRFGRAQLKPEMRMEAPKPKGNLSIMHIESHSGTVVEPITPPLRQPEPTPQWGQTTIHSKTPD